MSPSQRRHDTLEWEDVSEITNNEIVLNKGREFLFIVIDL